MVFLLLLLLPPAISEFSQNISTDEQYLADNAVA